MKKKKMLVADLLCGAGGSSTGCQRAMRELGLEMELVCLNHWPTAIETHQLNHPEARHYVQDISTVRPHLIVPEGYLDLLMASPTCTHHSVARGGKPTSDQQRSDPWHIITWLTELRVKRIIIENVWEYIGWGPVNAQTGKPVKSRKGEYFHAWIRTIQGLGFDNLEWRKLNAADYGDATTRQRFILMGRSDGRKVHWPMPTHRKREEVSTDLFADQLPWRPAREIIDWTIKGKSIFGRKKPLAPKTLVRIFAGAVKFKWPEPFLRLLLAEIDNSLRYHINWFFSVRNAHKTKKDRQKRRAKVRDTITKLRQFRESPFEIASGKRLPEPMVVTLRQNADGRSIEEPIPALAANGTHVGLADPVMINMKKGTAPSDVESPLPTQTSKASHMGMAEPVIMNGRKGNQAKPVSTDPIPTLDTKGGVWLAEPMVLSQHNSGAARSTEDPLPTITTGGAATEEHPGCARPMLVTVAHGNDAKEKDPNSRRANSVEDPLGAIHGSGSSHALVMSYYGNTAWCHSPDEPLATITAKERHSVVEPFVLSQASGGAARGVEEPIPAQTTGGKGGAHTLISPYYGSGSGETCVSAEEPLPTVTAKGRFGMVVPVTNSNGGAQARDINTDPLPTMTTARGGEFAAVLPVTHAGGENRISDVDDPLPTVTGANRGELAFITAQHGERSGQAPRVHDLDQPTPTIAATGHVDLIEATEGYDILFRMLEPHELAAAMGFSDEEQTYEFAGSKTDMIKQIGNAVSVKKMKACVRSMFSDVAKTEPANLAALQGFQEAAE